MVKASSKYCFDANALIKAWNGYYAPDICPSYWDILDSLGHNGVVFLSQHVKEEIDRANDDLTAWVEGSRIEVKQVNAAVISWIKKIYEVDPKHRLLVDNVKNRSLADPWVIAHALHEGATVVSNEQKITASTLKRIKIPNVCENMGVECINDFEFIRQVKIKFSCKI